MHEILLFYALATFLGVIAFPISFHGLGHLKDRGLACSRVLGLTLSAILVRVSGWAGLPPLSPWTLAVSSGLLTLLWIGWFLRYGKGLIRWFRANLSLVLKLELASLGVFLAACCLTALSPGFSGTEKLMDFAILKSIISSVSFPPLDPWYAGKPLAYYWFGHFQAALLCRLSGVPPETGYNLMLAFVFVSIFQVSLSLFAMRGFNAARMILAASLVAFGGNLVPVAKLLTFDTGPAFNSWIPTRIIPGTITEFPFFSLLVGDLHAHFLMLPCFMLFMVWLLPGPQGRYGQGLMSWNRPVILNLLIIATALGNPWNIPAMILVFAVMKWKCRVALSWWHIAPAVLFAPFLFKTGGSGLSIGWVSHEETSPLVPFMLMWGLPLAIITSVLAQETLTGLQAVRCNGKPSGILNGVNAWILPTVFILFAIAAHSTPAGLAFLILAAIFFPVRGRPGEWPWRAFAAAGLVLLIIPEFVYLIDAYQPPFQRMNTVFKMYYAAWPLIMSATGFALFRLNAAATGYAGAKGAFIVALSVSLAFVYPAVTVAERVAGRDISSLFLNGFLPLETLHGSDMRLVRYLAERMRPGDTCLEAVGHSYSWTGRISAFTGCPTILGWEEHESLWRGTGAATARRRGDAALIYSGTDNDTALDTVRKYGIDWIVACETETAEYGPNVLRALKGFIKEEFRDGACVLYSVNPSVHMDGNVDNMD